MTVITKTQIASTVFLSWSFFAGVSQLLISLFKLKEPVVRSFTWRFYAWLSIGSAVLGSILLVIGYSDLLSTPVRQILAPVAIGGCCSVPAIIVLLLIKRQRTSHKAELGDSQDTSTP